MKNLLFTVLIIITSLQLSAQYEIKAEQKKPLIIGETIEFQSNILKEKRTINVYLPADYKPESLKKYAVIYVLDGSLDEDFIHIAGLVQFASFDWINLIPETIVIGISNVDRKRDFTFPTQNEQDKKAFPTTGQSENFIRFIERELQPFVNQNYKTNSINTLIGQSLGGLLATEILFKNPELFNNYIIVSPSLWWDDESLLKTETQYYSSKKTIYIAVGKEGEVMERTAKELYDKLELQKQKNTTLYYTYFEKQNHGDALHLAVYNALESIFKISNE